MTTRTSLLCGMTVFLVLLNLQDATGLGQDATGLGQDATGLGQDATGLVATGPPLNCGVFSTGNPTVLTGMTVFDQKKMLNRFIACKGANSFTDIDRFYYMIPSLAGGMYKNIQVSWLQLSLGLMSWQEH